jgi:hypothetical protein
MIGMTFAALITLFAIGVFVGVPFLQPAAAIGVAVAGAGAALAVGGTVEGRIVTMRVGEVGG